VNWPDHTPLLDPELLDIIRRAAWTSAKSTEDVAPHQYVVKGWNKDDVTAQDFDLLAAAIKTYGRVEVWTPPDEWVRRWGGREQRNRYLYAGGYAMWFTFPRGRVPMLNRELTTWQQANLTRRVIEPEPEQTQLPL
jgi:hypothetical protein